MAFEYVDAPAQFNQYLKDIFTDEFMQAETNFKTFDAFQFSSAVFVNWKSDIMVYDKEVFDRFVGESTRFPSWEAMVCCAADRAVQNLSQTFADNLR